VSLTEDDARSITGKYERHKSRAPQRSGRGHR
jgi:hypothetical protein